MADRIGWTPTDYAALVQVANDMGVPADWLAAVMMSESSMRPWAKNPSGAQGLIQWASLGQDVTSWTPAQQLPLVEKYYAPWTPPGGWISRAQIYQANYLPATIAKDGSSPDTVIATKGDGLYQGVIFDSANKGYTTVGDLETRLARVVAGKTGNASVADWQAVLDGIAAAGGTIDIYPNTASWWTKGAAALIGGLAIGSAAFYVSKHLPVRPRARRRRRAYA